MKKILLILSLLITTTPILANSSLNHVNNEHIFVLAGALTIAFSVMAGTYSQGKTASAALEGVARNPGAYGKIFVTMILAMALIESLVLFGLLITFIILGKIN